MNIQFIGWCHQPSNNHDKVWGIAKKDDNLFMTFWGRRGGKLSTNTKDMDSYDASKLIRSKQKKGYQEFEQSELDEIHENFKKQIFIVSLRGH